MHHAPAMIKICANDQPSLALASPPFLPPRHLRPLRAFAASHPRTDLSPGDRAGMCSCPPAHRGGDTGGKA